VQHLAVAAFASGTPILWQQRGVLIALFALFAPI
jgi:hypothetical protein